jgi:phosphoribosyl-ATP pyrophosphohydrolase/phosphoribosyl-AMP cyclohydrolase
MKPLKPDFLKFTDGLIPAIIQDANTNIVLMLGYMSKEAMHKTIETKLVTFYSRSRKRLWTKGEVSRNYLHLIDIKLDCDSDTFLIKAKPVGPACHTGSDTCFNEENIGDKENFLVQLEKIVESRRKSPKPKSYISSLLIKGLNAVAQKVGEEAVELIIEAKDNDAERFKNEAADLLFHYLILLQAKGFELNDITDILKTRHQAKK